jgi:ParB family chromosome partitioning protein
MKETKRPGQQLKGLTVPELLGVTGEESAMEIELRLIHPFQNHPFKVVDDEKMQDLVDSIRANGVLSPVLLRESGHGQYEMISGHRRMHAARLAGLDTIPAIIREMTDDEATIIMVDSNIQREELLPSEKAFAYKMRLEAMRRQAGRPAKNAGHNDQHLMGKLSRDILAEEIGTSSKQVHRYIRLTYLIPELLDMVDNKRITFVSGVEISYLEQEVQKWLCEYIHDNGVIKMEQIIALRTRVESGSVNQSQMIMVLNDSLKGRLPAVKVNLTEKKLRRYFPASYSADQMEGVILALLEGWKNTHGGE